MNGLAHSTLPVQCGNRSIRTIITTSDDGKVLECRQLCESIFDHQQTALMDRPMSFVLPGLANIALVRSNEINQREIFNKPLCLPLSGRAVPGQKLCQ